MASRQGVFSSSVGTKILIGATGLLLFLYLLIHIAGNLVVFLGPAAYNKYAFTLENNHRLLLLIELVLLSWFVVHIYKTVRMYLGNQSARPVAYAKKKSAGHTTRKTFASSTMILSGLWLLAFLLIHVKTFRDGWGNQYEWPAGGRDLYRQEMEVFQNPLVVAFYVISMLVVGIGYHVAFMLGLRRLRTDMRDDGLIHGESHFPPSLTLIVALLLLLVGLLAILSMLFHIGPFES